MHSVVRFVKLGSAQFVIAIYGEIMTGAVYFSRIEYREVIGDGNRSSIMLLNIPEQATCDYTVYAVPFTQRVFINS